MTIHNHPIDHLVAIAPSLSSAVAGFSRLLGVTPIAVAGVHGDPGTCQVQVGLGSDSFLEVLCAEENPPADSPGAHLARLAGPVLHTFAVRSTDMAISAERIQRAGLKLDPIYAFSRRDPNDVLLEWKLGVISGHRFGSLLPCLVEYKGIPQFPASRSSGCSLESLVAYCPVVSGLKSIYDAIGITLEVKQSDERYLEACLVSPGGRIELCSVVPLRG